MCPLLSAWHGGHHRTWAEKDRKILYKTLRRQSPETSPQDVPEGRLLRATEAAARQASLWGAEIRGEEGGPPLSGRLTRQLWDLGASSRQPDGSGPGPRLPAGRIQGLSGQTCERSLQTERGALAQTHTRGQEGPLRVTGGPNRVAHGERADAVPGSRRRTSASLPAAPERLWLHLLQCGSHVLFPDSRCRVK